MGVKLSDFAKRIIVERKLIRKNKGPSIVPLMIIRFIDYVHCDETYYGPRADRMLLTVCQRTASISGQVDLTKLYSGTPYVGYADWWNRSEVVSIRPPRPISTSRLIEVNIKLIQVNNHDQEQRAGW